MKWTEGRVHVAMRSFLRSTGWHLIAGEYPGGSDHDLYPLNVVDPAVARDRSPDPRRHSKGELIPDLVALKERDLLVIEAKPNYNEADREKLAHLLSVRREDFLAALEKFAVERRFEVLLPVHTLLIRPVLAFAHSARAPAPSLGLSYLRVVDRSEAFFEGVIGEQP